MFNHESTNLAEACGLTVEEFQTHLNIVVANGGNVTGVRKSLAYAVEQAPAVRGILSFATGRTAGESGSASGIAEILFPDMDMEELQTITGDLLDKGAPSKVIEATMEFEPNIAVAGCFLCGVVIGIVD